MPLHVMVNESSPGVAQHAIELLEQHGHRVLRCHDLGESPYPCAALRPGHVCPLECGIDVAITVRDRPDAEPSRREDGVTCALRARIPVVVAGELDGNPFRALGAVEVDDGHVAQPCEWLVATPSPAHTTVATDALLAALRVEPGDAEAVVHRRREGLRVVIDAVPSVDSHAIALAAPQVLTALRRFDRDAPSIDLSIKE